MKEHIHNWIYNDAKSETRAVRGDKYVVEAYICVLRFCPGCRQYEEIELESLKNQ